MRSFFLCMLLLINSALYAQSSLGLIAHWDMNGTTNDVSGNGHDGHLNFVTSVPDRFGNPNGAYSFNGSTSVITVPYQADLNLTNFSLCAIVNIQGFNGGLCQGNFVLCRGPLLTPGSYVLNFDDNAYDGNNCTALDSTQDVFTTSAGTNVPSATSAWYCTPTIVKNVWYKVVTTWDGVQFKVFENGALKITAVAVSGSMGSSTDSLAIGMDIFDGPTYPYPFKGFIDDMRIYNRVLTDSETVHYGDTCGKITSQPAASVASVGSTTTFTVNTAMVAAGYQWQQDGGTGFVNLSNSGPYSGVTTSTLTITGVTSSLNSYHYRCLLSNTWICNDTTASVPLTTITTGINSVISGELVNIYPNPAHSNITVQLPYNGESEVVLMNEIGQVVSLVRFVGNSQVLDIASISAGIYILKVKGGDFTVYKKVIKE